MAEDSYFCAHDIGVILEAEGARIIGPFGSARMSIAAVRSQPLIDFALVDMNLSDAFADELAEVLIDHGVPYAVVTGYGALPTATMSTAVAVVQKPVDPVELINVVELHHKR